MQFDEPGVQSLVITAHMVLVLYEISKELRKTALILIDNGTRTFLQNVQIPKITTDAMGKMTCYYVNLSLPPPP
jgi:hypothetical protein